MATVRLQRILSVSCLWAVLALPALAACMAKPDVHPSPTSSLAGPTASTAPLRSDAKSADILHDWLSGTPCRPPCWQGIIPGETLASNALAILKTNPDIGSIDKASGTWSGTYEGAFYWSVSHSSGGGAVEFEGNPAVVTNMSVGQNNALTLQQVIDVYGEPSHVYAWAGPCVDTDCVVYWLVVLFVPDGFALSWDSRASRPELKPEWRDFYVMFFEPNVQGFAAAWGNPTVEDAITPWRGMLGFDDYCTGESCKSP